LTIRFKVFRSNARIMGFGMENGNSSGKNRFSDDSTTKIRAEFVNNYAIALQQQSDLYLKMSEFE
jgi:hypothetical protein